MQVNNAGVAKKAINVENVDLVMQTNYFGVKRVTEAMLPIFRHSPAGSRIVIVASRSGLLRVLVQLVILCAKLILANREGGLLASGGY